MRVHNLLQREAQIYAFPCCEWSWSKISSQDEDQGRCSRSIAAGDVWGRGGRGTNGESTEHGLNRRFLQWNIPKSDCIGGFLVKCTFSTESSFLAGQRIEREDSERERWLLPGCFSKADVCWWVLSSFFFFFRLQTLICWHFWIKGLLRK